MIKPLRPSWNLSFSGAGHLISYHLGVARTLLQNETAAIQSVAGSSSGAIAAAVIAYLPHRVDEYTDRFIKDGGRAFANFCEMVDETSTNLECRPVLHIATTRCDGSLKVFSFQSDNLQAQRDKMLQSLEASCRIPLSFHPWDVFSKNAPSYPQQNSIEIDGNHYIDGGIAAPCPQIEYNDGSTNIVISPISGSSSAKWNIRPNDASWKLPLIDDIAARCGTFAVRPSVNNIRAFVVSAGAASPQVLKDWHKRGVDDAHMFLEQWRKEAEEPK
eukprot:scaffold15942_cov78-Cyclotella_meneghiniana.AAC.15